MMREYQIIKLGKMADAAINTVGQLASSLAQHKTDKEKVLAELNFQREIYDTCRQCLTV